VSPIDCALRVGGYGSGITGLIVFGMVRGVDRYLEVDQYRRSSGACRWVRNNESLTAGRWLRGRVVLVGSERRLVGSVVLVRRPGTDLSGGDLRDECGFVDAGDFLGGW
jgi:hypothetical protein